MHRLLQPSKIGLVHLATDLSGFRFVINIATDDFLQTSTATTLTFFLGDDHRTNRNDLMNQLNHSGSSGTKGSAAGDIRAMSAQPVKPYECTTTLTLEGSSRARMDISNIDADPEIHIFTKSVPRGDTTIGFSTHSLWIAEVWIRDKRLTSAAIQSVRGGETDVYGRMLCQNEALLSRERGLYINRLLNKVQVVTIPDFWPKATFRLPVG
ncbi:hypothetical protein IW261DRAFT_1420052 [Armillaria novae-zelandiae]|uniref:Uncharacterized protein n=1 Tax=Armillaria novae-zelandiae TaxID=153914 RepID=A0AA39P909_9AGAR|nr:hypothetical protein IW261DRAFT_1420052 [Armillaria novae-zelandiae]